MQDWRAWAVKAAEWGADYRARLRELPVRPPVKPGEKSDPYLMTGYEKKMLTLTQSGVKSARIRVEVDLTGTGKGVEYAAFDVTATKPKVHVFPDGFQAYWLRVSSDQATIATAWLVYE